MRVITITRTLKRQRQQHTSINRRPFGEFARRFFAGENHWEFAIEALIFAALLAITALPIVAAASAIAQLLQSAPS